MNFSSSFAVEAPYASHPIHSRGRIFDESESATRTCFQRDRDRVLHSTAFRRLAHKTQVFIPFEGDHYRTRLTHTIEVGQISRALARALRLNEDLAEAIALAHDLGHPPFGHTGEEALHICMQPFGGFNHNLQTFRIVTQLEQHYASFDGLNLTWETCEGIVKHNGPLPYSEPALFHPYDLHLALFASAEAQGAALADDIAYHAHDIEDGLRSGLLTYESLQEVALLRDIQAEISRLWPHLEPTRCFHELTRRLLTYSIEDAIRESQRRLEQVAPKNVEHIRAHGTPMIGFSSPMRQAQEEIKHFLQTHLYFHPHIQVSREKSMKIVTHLFHRFWHHPSYLPEVWRERAHLASQELIRARLICDYIAGMTDRYATALTT